MGPSGRSAHERAIDKRLVEDLLAGVSVTLSSSRDEVTVHAEAGGQVTGVELTGPAMRLGQEELGALLTRVIRSAVRKSLLIEHDGLLALGREPDAAEGAPTPPVPEVALVTGDAGEADDEQVEADRRALAAFAEAALLPPTTVASAGGEVAVTATMGGEVARVTIGDAGMALPPDRLAAVVFATLRQTDSWAGVVRTDRIERAAERIDAEEQAAQAEQEAERRLREG